MKESQARNQKQTLLLDSAAEAFASKGYHQTSIRDICEGAGVATGTYYLYFQNKEQSCLALIQMLYSEVLEEVVKARTPERNIPDKLRRSIEVALKVFARNQKLAKIALIQAPGAHPDFDRRLMEIHKTLASLVQQDLDEAIEAGAIPPQDTYVVARALVGGLYEVVISWLREGKPDSIEEAIPSLVTFSLRGIGAG